MAKFTLYIQTEKTFTSVKGQTWIFNSYSDLNQHLNLFFQPHYKIYEHALNGDLALVATNIIE